MELIRVLWKAKLQVEQVLGPACRSKAGIMKIKCNLDYLHKKIKDKILFIIEA
jgi:hypothetical protein